MRFYEQLKKGEEYAVISVTLPLLQHIKDEAVQDEHFTLHFIKENNPKFKEDELLKDLYSQKSKLARKITKREQEIR